LHWGEEMAPAESATPQKTTPLLPAFDTSQWYGVLLVVSVLLVNLLAAWALSGTNGAETLAYESGWIEESPSAGRAVPRAPVTVFAAPLSERRTARYLSMDALDAPDPTRSGAETVPPPEAER
jgi:hypothetical protein